MGTLTIHSRYTFGDHVQYLSQMGISKGKVSAIIVDELGCVSYVIEIEKGHYSEFEHHVLQTEIIGEPTKGSNLHALTIAPQYQFGDLVRFDSINGKGTGKVHEIMLDPDGVVSYVVEIDVGTRSEFQPGILESEIQAKIDQDRERNL